MPQTLSVAFRVACRNLRIVPVLVHGRSDRPCCDGDDQTKEDRSDQGQRDTDKLSNHRLGRNVTVSDRRGSDQRKIDAVPC